MLQAALFAGDCFPSAMGSVVKEGWGGEIELEERRKGGNGSPQGRERRQAHCVIGVVLLFALFPSLL